MRIANTNKNGLRVDLARAIRLSRQGKHRSALEILQPLSRRYPNSASVFGSIGSAFFELGEMSEAAAAFRRAVKLNPKSELASLGLFHSLWDQNAISEAFAEMRRFLKNARSNEYTALLRDMVVQGQLMPRHRPAGAA